MTRNQLTYQANLEVARSNRAREFETNRANLAKEAEARRSNMASEVISGLTAPFGAVGSLLKGVSSLKARPNTSTVTNIRMPRGVRQVRFN